jgi:hypothetical protein
MTDHFSSGPRLVEPCGDPRRQAVDSLRGYAYQLYVSALAWLRLQSEERLYLEVAEDFTLVSRDALEGVQVKDTSGSGRVTINSEDVRQALASFVELVKRNPRVKVTLRFLSTSEIGVEKSLEDRAAAQSVLEYWRKAASGADVTPLREAVLRAEITDEVRTFIQARDDDALRRDLLQRVFWDCGFAALDGVKRELADALVVYGSDRLRLTPRDVEGLPAMVVGEVLDASLRSEAHARWLDAAALLRLCEERTRTAVPKSLLEDLIRNVFPSSGGGSAPVVSRRLLESVNAVPMPTDVLPRQRVVQDVLQALSRFPLAFLNAGTGMGKSVVARLVVRSRPGEWMMLDLRDLSDDECEFRLAAAVGEAASVALSGILVEDINQLDSNRRVASAFGRLVDALRRRDAVCLATCYRPVAGGVLDSIGCGEAACYTVPALNEAEVARLVQNYGGEPGAWTQAVFIRGGQGHPQLVRAALVGLRRRAWPANELSDFSASDALVDDIESERMSVRRRLVDSLEEAPRNLLYRTSLLLGRFQRQLALTIGGISPEIRSPGEALDTLVGPWIDSAGRDLLRVSPLAANSGFNVLSRAEQLAVHRAAAAFLFSDGLRVDAADELFLHAVSGESDEILLQLALAVVTESDQKHRPLALWLPNLRVASTDRPISTGRADVARVLRLAQFLLVVAISDARASAVWESLSRETANETDIEQARGFETMALSKALLASKLPDAFPGWLQLLRRLRTLFNEDPKLQEIATRAERGAPLYEGSRPTTLGLLFLFNASNVQHISQQLDLFLALNSLPAEERREYLSFALASRGAMTTVVNAPWLAEVGRETINGHRAAGEYLQMSALANGWGEQALAIALRVVSSVMLDEYANDSDRALATLRAAESEFGQHFDLARARAKIHFRQRRHADMLAVVHDLSTQLGNFDPLERAFLLRETGIGAAEQGDWARAASWFERAHDDAQTLPGDVSRRLAIGLRADMALAYYKGGDQHRAIELYEGVIEALPSIDGQDALGSVYLSRVARHGVLWLFLQATGEDPASMAGEDFTTLVPGMCSNLNPPEQVREKELASLDVTWYLFAIVESQTMPPTAALERLRGRLRGRQIPSMELMVIERLVEGAIGSQAVNEFVSLFRLWIDHLVYWENHRDAMAQSSVAHPVYGVAPAAHESQLASTFILESTQHSILGFCIVAACCGHADRIATLRTELPKSLRLLEAERLLDVMLGTQTIPGATELPDFAATQVRNVTVNATLTPEELFEATLRFSQVALRSRFKKPVGAAVEKWVRQRWGAEIPSPSLFATPKLAIPAIQRALETSGLAGVPTVLLAAEQYQRLRLSPDLREYLVSAAKSMRPSSDAVPALDSSPARASSGGPR